MSFTIKVKKGMSVLFVVIHAEFSRFMMAGFIQIYHWAFKNNFENKFSISCYTNQYKQTITVFKGSNTYKYLLCPYFNFTIP